MRRSWSGLVFVLLLTAGCGTAAELADTAPESRAPAARTSEAEPGDSSRSGDRGSGPGAGGDRGGVRLRLPNDVGPRPVFLTPSRNIGCAISSDQVRCDIVERSYDLPPKPASCHGGFGRSIAVGRAGIAAFVCVRDTVIDPGAPILGYGSSTQVGDFGCTSSTESISCYHLESDHGFELSRDSPALF